MKNVLVIAIVAVIFFLIGLGTGRYLPLERVERGEEGVASTGPGGATFYNEDDLKMVNLKILSNPQKEIALEVLNSVICRCPICLKDGLTLAKCVVERKECRTGHILSRKAVKLIREGKSKEEVSKILTEPERIEISLDGAIISGSEDAPVTIVEFTDFQCPFCKKAQGTMKEIEAHYGDRVRVAYRAKPLKRHKFAAEAARAAVAAENQGKFKEMKALLFEYSRELNSEKIDEIAREAGLDMKRFRDDMKTDETARRVEQDLEYADSIGVTSTPTFFINGIKVRGARPFDDFKVIIDRELEKGEK